MPDPTNDIEALLDWCEFNAMDWHRALERLVAERDKAKADFSDAWRERCEFARRIDEAEGAIFGIVAERNALKQRVAELEARAKPVYITDGQRVESIDLRERLVCAALTGLMAQPAHGSRESWANIAVSFADATLAAMRKGEA